MKFEQFVVARISVAIRYPIRKISEIRGCKISVATIAYPIRKIPAKFTIVLFVKFEQFVVAKSWLQYFSCHDSLPHS